MFCHMYSLFLTSTKSWVKREFINYTGTICLYHMWLISVTYRVSFAIRFDSFKRHRTQVPQAAMVGKPTWINFSPLHSAIYMWRLQGYKTLIEAICNHSFIIYSISNRIWHNEERKSICNLAHVLSLRSCGVAATYAVRLQSFVSYSLHLNIAEACTAIYHRHCMIARPTRANMSRDTHLIIAIPVDTMTATRQVTPVWPLSGIYLGYYLTKRTYFKMSEMTQYIFGIARSESPYQHHLKEIMIETAIMILR